MIDEAKLIKLAREIIGDEGLELETNKEEIDKWDSLAHVMLIAAVEENFGISIPIENVSEICCLKDFEKYEK